MEKALTEKSRSAITEAQGQALDRHNPTLEPEHLLFALLDQKDGLVSTIVRQAGREPSAIRTKIESALDALPRVESAHWCKPL